ncbi:unnamed protein product [Gongylonema pulchrum]|uniref:Uncharacterized protein n=1 Tax=Gongylonema pulchrum TaxID=637853 RepID=A0A3P7P0G3_9BILA|nr:unnamed protein product [Gongylonema pulchrum]
MASIQQQQRLLELLTQQQLTGNPASAPNGTIASDCKIGGVSATSANNLIQLTGQNTSPNMDPLQQAYAGLQQFTG